ncbi:hypothetical protein Bcav_0622 [Beutenbergia cavernae DSM 12333]|uniref:DUF4244 domain-containing protein n=1 Tax=Beutenbergia cavernae (strain ATCC BAA-8 / DSM 12333 / CCUG 43141 / JCM 11478 / NBRC 16432 / NCIMB 13614 / HKI 0122) TaxID=471853 RepID=C5BXZ0_BEUC1|nr:DUF4244 domain-containing protein [Beutenbergia cavernae]ACQ78884.1 hypothetical protein Bcav_0622 [Beutenbergia cavernae DSM 12333]
MSKESKRSTGSREVVSAVARVWLTAARVVRCVLTRAAEGPVAALGRVVAMGRARRRLVVASAEAGMATAEYAIATLAAVAFAGLLLVILRSGEVREMLLSIIRDALSV